MQNIENHKTIACPTFNCDRLLYFEYSFISIVVEEISLKLSNLWHNFRFVTSLALCTGKWCNKQKNPILTHNTPTITHTSFTYSKLNMDEICGLKFYLLYVHTSQKIFLKFLHAQGLFQVFPVGCLSLVLLNWDRQQGRSEKDLAHGGI